MLADGPTGGVRQGARARLSGPRFRGTFPGSATITSTDQTGGLAGEPAGIAPYPHPALTLRTCGVMPAKGVTQTPIETPLRQSLDGDAAVGVVVEAVKRIFTARRKTVTALEGMSMSAHAREIVAVVGPSGCGKTTLLELICGLQAAGSAGTVRAAPAALMPQRDLLLPWLAPSTTPAWRCGPWAGSGAQARATAGPWFERSGWRASSRRGRPSSRAGCASGSRSSARCWPASRCCALDEPFAALDAITRAEMQGWLGRVLERASRARWCWSPTTSRRPSCSPTGSS